jgi:DNA repair protein RecN (Recombination protein N)
MTHVQTALALLNGLGDDTPSASDLLSQAERAAMALARLDPTLGPAAERFQGLVYQLSEVAGELMDYQERLEFNPSRLNFVEERLELIGRLKRKYGDDVGAIIAWKEEAERQLDQFTHGEQHLAELEQAGDELLHEIGRLAGDLSERRQGAAVRLAAAIEQELGDLHMERARFQVGFAQAPAEDGAYVGDQRLAFDESGIDQVEFLISANPGEPLRPLARVASGGETSRLMLALKTSLALADPTPTLIFDEIDQGIGGRVGDVVGRKLWRLAAAGGHQVIVVTHLPQLAGYADGHFQVSKEVRGERTTTRVDRLEEAGRLQELAAMLGAQGESATQAAGSILNHVTVVKREK